MHYFALLFCYVYSKIAANIGGKSRIRREKERQRQKKRRGPWEAFAAGKNEREGESKTNGSKSESDWVALLILMICCYSKLVASHIRNRIVLVGSIIYSRYANVKNH